MVYSLPSEYIVEILEDSYEKGEKGYSHFTLQRMPELATEILGFNLNHPLYSNQEFRKAIAFSLNRVKLVDKVLNGQAFEAGNGGFVPPGFNKYPYEKIHGYGYNADSARIYMEKSKIDVLSLPALTLHIASKGKFNVSIASEIRKELKDVLGIQIDIKIVAMPELIEGISNGEIAFYRIGWSADYPSLNDFLGIFSSEKLPSDPKNPSFPNIGRYRNPKFDQWFNLARISDVDSFKMGFLFKSGTNIDEKLSGNSVVVR